MRVLHWFLATLVVAKHHHRHTKSTHSLPESSTEPIFRTTVTARPSTTTVLIPAAISGTSTSTSSRQLQTRDSGDMRTLKHPTRSFHDAETKTLPVTSTVTLPPEFTTTTEATTITATASPTVASTLQPSNELPSTVSKSVSTSPAGKCYETLGGVQNGKVIPGCGGMLAHITICNNDHGSTTNPLNASQNFELQACICGTSIHEPFTSNSVFYSNFTGCAACLLSSESPNSRFVYTAAQTLWNFCRSQNPVAYLFYFELYKALNQAPMQTDGLFSGSHSLAEALDSGPSTTPPLANLAYGSSAPPDGSLAKVTPSLITYTTSMTESAEGSVVLETIASLVAWVPTQAGKAWHPASASHSEASAVSSRLANDLCKDKDLGQCPKSVGLRKGPKTTLLWLCVATFVMSSLLDAVL